VFTSVPAAAPSRVKDPAPVTLHVQVKTGLAPLEMVCGKTPTAAPHMAVAVEPAATDGDTLVMLALDPPMFVTLKLIDSCWPTLTVMGLVSMLSEATIVAGDWMVTDAVAAPVDTAAELLASVPLAEALRLSVPGDADEQLV